MANMVIDMERILSTKSILFMILNLFLIPAAFKIDILNVTGDAEGASNTPKGPSVKFLVENIHTMSELKMTGNCLKGSRPLLSFDKIFSTPNQHPKSQPFIDHVYTFSIADNRIWFRNYQILEEDGSLAEIGPRFVLNPIRIFEGSFGGPTLYQNPHYVSPNDYRRILKKKVAHKYISRVYAKKSLDSRRSQETYKSDITDDVFVTIKPEDAKGAAKNTFYRNA
ncbi:hypothetical protein KUTeg_016227 [Tegillarca granosa]|uniref:Ribosome biogenesis protein BRX1 homolog n=1 Tax=Tegillarca granosa TaxID=220873 RepID=A0ABQ9EQ02_TEGGR|nr:hypothetical protein KUTeg_016227 [Tegillarca granosa]